MRFRREFDRLPLVLLGLFLGLLGAASCVDRSAEESTRTLATFDSVLVELGRIPAGRMDRIPRWRMISSIWAGLPPANFDRSQLPEPRSHGAGLLEAYCTQCHWMPAPQMHAAEEWPLLVRRMVLRARALTEHLGGPVTRRLVGDSRTLEGMAITAIPSEAEQEGMIAYLSEHALPTVEPAELPSAPGREAFLRICTRCHQTPAPAAHPAAEWAGIVDRMQSNMKVIGVEGMSQEEEARVKEYLRQVAPAEG